MFRRTRWVPSTPRLVYGGDVVAESDFYRQLLELGTCEELEPFLAEALALVVKIAGARMGYIELLDESARGEPRYSLAHGCSEMDVAEIRAVVSHGVIAAAIASGKTIATASALLDPRFQERESVRRNRIEAVVCAPIAKDPPVGIVYLQDRSSGGPFSEDDRIRVEVFARHLSTLADRLLLRRRSRDEADVSRDARSKLRIDGFIGRGEATARLLEQIALAAPLHVTVLLTGSCGTGKTQLARAIHASSPRSSGPFVELNCAALPESLLESELFGAVAGAHSTAARKVEGKVSAAEGGTLLLDEVGELTLSAQAKLLQLLQSREYYSLGASRPTKANVRIVAATNVDLEAAVARKAFREDLFYRLHVVAIRVPDLSERREDIAELARFFTGRACEMHGLPTLTIARSAVHAVEAAEWPGNVRQLAHSMEAAAIRAAGRGLSHVEASHVFPQQAGGSHAEATLTFQEATRRFQADLLGRTLEETEWNVTEAAKRLDLTRAHVYSLIKSFGLKRAEPAAAGRA